jgi:adenylyltransferase/sulfurtransferase
MSPASHDRIEVGVTAEDDRYHRQNLISWWDQRHLSAAEILVVGAGALGNEIVKNLVLMGIGRIFVVDMDHIENSNLSRCVFFRESDEGRMKAEVLAERAAELNREVEVIPLVGDVRTSVGLGTFNCVDVVIGGLDNREARLYVNQACWKTSTPWIDGAIEGLMGTVRLFVPPETACYECTMSERDHELVAARRSCTLLSREEMLEGKVPTNATMSSIVGGAQAQEAVKLLHSERLGEPTLAGAGYHFVGLTHDSYLVRYQRRDDCLSHDTYELDSAKNVPPKTTFAALLAMGRDELGEDAILELEQEVVLGGDCASCGISRDIHLPVDALDLSDGRCQSCGQALRLEFTHLIDDDSSLLDLCPADLGLPPFDVAVCRTETERTYFMVGDSSDLPAASSGVNA